MHLKADERIDFDVIYDLLEHQPQSLISVQLKRLREACPGLHSYVETVMKDWPEEMRATLMACIARMNRLPKTRFFAIPEISDENVDLEDHFIGFASVEYAQIFLCLLHGKEKQEERETVRHAFNCIHYAVRTAT